MAEQPAIKDTVDELSDDDTDREDEDGVDGGGGSGDSGGMLPSVSLSRTHLLILGVVVALALAWKLKSGDASSAGSQSAREVEKVREMEVGDATIRDEEGDDEVEIVVPSDPSDELEKDDAVVQALKENGTISLGGD